MDNTMKAVVVRNPMEYGIEDVPKAKCGERGILVKVLACGLCGSDIRTLRTGHRKIEFPWIIGHEISGTVVEVGAEYRGRWKVGDNVAVAPLAYCGTCDFCISGQYDLCDNTRELAREWHGGFAEYVAIPEECLNYGTILPIPEGLDPVIAAVSEPISSCVNAQEKANVGLGDTVVIIGSGPIGSIHVSIAKARGAERVIVADVQESRLKLVEPFGPHLTIDASKVNLVEEVMRITNGKGANVVITANPVPDTLVQAVEMARKGGRVLIFGGLPVGKSTPPVDMNLIHYRGIHVMGTTTFSPKHQIAALSLLSTGRIPGDKLVTHVLPLDKFNEGAQLAMDGKALKVVFVP